MTFLNAELRLQYLFIYLFIFLTEDFNIEKHRLDLQLKTDVFCVSSPHDFINNYHFFFPSKLSFLTVLVYH